MKTSCIFMASEVVLWKDTLYYQSKSYESSITFFSEAYSHSYITSVVHRKIHYPEKKIFIAKYTYLGSR